MRLKKVRGPISIVGQGLKVRSGRSTAMAAKRFIAFSLPPQRRDALLGRAAAGLLTGEAAKHQAHAFAWLFVQPGSEKPACQGQAKAADQPPAK